MTTWLTGLTGLADLADLASLTGLTGLDDLVILLTVHQENEEEKIIHYNHSMQWIMLDMIRYVQVID